MDRNSADNLQNTFSGDPWACDSRDESHEPFLEMARRLAEYRPHLLGSGELSHVPRVVIDLDGMDVPPVRETIEIEPASDAFREINPELRYALYTRAQGDGASGENLRGVFGNTDDVITVVNELCAIPEDDEPATVPPGCDGELSIGPDKTATAHPAADDLRDRVDEKIRQPILIGLEDPCGLQRAGEWADYIRDWVMEVIAPALAGRDKELTRLRADLAGMTAARSELTGGVIRLTAERNHLGALLDQMAGLLALRYSPTPTPASGGTGGDAVTSTTPYANTGIRPAHGQPVHDDPEDGVYWLLDDTLMYAPYLQAGGLDWDNAGDVDMSRSDPDVIERARRISDNLRARASTDQASSQNIRSGGSGIAPPPDYH